MIATWTIEEVKSGHIRPYHGLIANIPTGWILCDGNNGTPDLRGLFPKGAPAGQEAGALGGSATHTHADHPGLTHSGAAVGDHAAGVTGTFAATSKLGTSTANVATIGHNHTTPALVHSVTQPGQHGAQGHDSPNSEPPFRTVLWIMKT